MNCPKCGTILADGSPFCSSCGTQLAGAPQQGQMMPGQFPGQNPYGMPPPPMPGYGVGPYGEPVMPRTSGMAIAGFVLSFFCSLLGLIFSIIGYNECKKSNGTVTGEGLALAGIIISILSMLIGIFWVMAVNSAAHHSSSW